MTSEIRHCVPRADSASTSRAGAPQFAERLGQEPDQDLYARFLRRLLLKEFAERTV